MGLKEILQDVIESPYSITSAFDTIKNIFNEALIFVYQLSFFGVFILFMLLAIGIFIVLPIYLIRNYVKYKPLFDAILSFDFSFIMPKSLEKGKVKEKLRLN